MRSSATLVALADPVEPQQTGVDQVVRTLAGLIDIANRGRVPMEPSGNPVEEMLVDTADDGARYFLLRMRRPGLNRIQLSPREQEIVRMVAKGHPNKVIADVLNISSWTVCTHLRRIFAKLGVGSRAAMVAQLLESGVLTSERRIPSDPR